MTHYLTQNTALCFLLEPTDACLTHVAHAKVKTVGQDIITLVSQPTFQNNSWPNNQLTWYQSSGHQTMCPQRLLIQPQAYVPDIGGIPSVPNSG